MKRIRAFILVALFVAGNVTGQTIQEADKGLVVRLQQISYWNENWSKDTTADRDSLGNANEQFEKYLRAICLKLPIDANFPLAQKEGLDQATAADKKVRIYSWDTWQGGSMHIYNSLQVYKDAKVNTIFGGNDVDSAIKDNGDGGYSYSEMETVKSTDNTVTYLVFGQSRESTKDRGEQVFALRIVNNILVSVPLFKTQSKTLKSISYSYDLFATADRYKNSDPPSMHLSEDKKKLYIPVVDNEEITKRNLVYVFDGNYYVFDKNIK